jgi:hypothetical protein
MKGFEITKPRRGNAHFTIVIKCLIMYANGFVEMRESNSISASCAGQSFGGGNIGLRERKKAHDI